MPSGRCTSRSSVRMPVPLVKPSSGSSRSQGSGRTPACSQLCICRMHRSGSILDEARRHWLCRTQHRSTQQRLSRISGRCRPQTGAADDDRCCTRWYAAPAEARYDLFPTTTGNESPHEREVASTHTAAAVTAARIATSQQGNNRSSPYHGIENNRPLLYNTEQVYCSAWCRMGRNPSGWHKDQNCALVGLTVWTRFDAFTSF
jgi:hypothetical protein